MNLITKALTYLYSWLELLQMKRILVGVLLGFLLLTATAQAGQINSPINNKFDNGTHRDVQRPTTTREWRKEVRATEGKPMKRLERIGKESVEAIKEWGEVYPDTAERSARALEDNTRQ
jgi:hypothetical protein